MANVLYDSWKGQINVRDWTSVTIKAMLMKAAYTPNQATDVHVSDIVANELTSSAYVRKTLANKYRTVDTVNHRCGYGADNITWTALGAGVVAGAAIFYDTGSDATAELICYLDTIDVDPNGVDYVLRFNGGASAGDVFRFS